MKNIGPVVIQCASYLAIIIFATIIAVIIRKIPYFMKKIYKLFIQNRNKTSVILLPFFVLSITVFILLSGSSCAYNSKISAPTTNVTAKNLSTAESLYQNLFIGESLISGFAYLEPFKADEWGNSDEAQFENHPDSINFFSIDNAGVVYQAKFNAMLNIYVPTIEETDKFFYHGSNEDAQRTLQYKINDPVKEYTMGIALFNYEIAKIDFSCKGYKRKYSDSEYKASALHVQQQLDDISAAGGGVLRDITIEDTIVGAKQICTINVKKSTVTMRLSEYMSIGFESFAHVYVVDFVDNNGNVIKTNEILSGIGC